MNTTVICFIDGKSYRVPFEAHGVGLIWLAGTPNLWLGDHLIQPDGIYDVQGMDLSTSRPEVQS